jgi:hypothetical protein
MNHQRFFGNRKGQSAIEYLMTYGWMLLVVAIVGGAIFATVQSNNQGCNTEIPMALSAQQQGFGVSQFGASPGNTQVVLTNNGQDQVTVNSVTVNAAGTTDSSSPGTSLGTGEETTVSLSGFSEAEGCNDVMITVDYDMGGLTGQTMSGNLTAQLQ